MQWVFAVIMKWCPTQDELLSTEDNFSRMEALTKAKIMHSRPRWGVGVKPGHLDLVIVPGVPKRGK